MTDTAKLAKRIEASGYKKSYIAKTLGITTHALSMKVRNLSEFKASEIDTICRLLGITDAGEKEAIFFAVGVD